MRTKNKISVALFCFLFATFSVCDAKESSDPTLSAAPSPYPVLDSGVWADAIFDPQIYWLDNNHVIFKNSEEKMKTKHYDGRFNLAIWEIGKGITAYTPYVKGIYVCVSEKNIFYVLEDDNKNMKRFYGVFGKEKNFEFPKTKGAFHDKINCRTNDNPEILTKRAHGRVIIPLLDRHGYLDRGSIRYKPGVKEPVVFYRTGQPTGIELPILGRDASIIRYYPFKDAYLIHALDGGGPVKGKRFWWLYPDGKVEEGLHPVEFSLYATRQGIVTDWGGTKSVKDPGTVGLYLWRDKEPVKLIPGYARGIVVSPDGCKLAFVHYLYSDATKIKDPGRITLTAINVCAEEKTHGQ